MSGCGGAGSDSTLDSAELWVDGYLDCCDGVAGDDCSVSSYGEFFPL